MFKLGGNRKSRKSHKHGSKGKHRHRHKHSGDARKRHGLHKHTRKQKKTLRKSRKLTPKRKTKKKSKFIRSSKSRFTKKRSKTPKGSKKGFSSRARKNTQYAHHHPIKTKKQCNNTNIDICGRMKTKGEQCKLTKPKKRKDGTLFPVRCVKKSKKELSHMKHTHGPNWGRKELNLKKRKSR